MAQFRTTALASFTGLILLATSCTGDLPEEPSLDPPSAGKSRVQCLPGCTEEDPEPTHPGVFLTSAVTGPICFGAPTTRDTDNDGLSDRCENDLAAAFAPYFRYNSADNVGRESYWAARKTLKTIRIIYLLGYYIDLGVQGSNNYTACKLSSIGGLLASCDGHSGDSEHVILDVYYNSTTQRWLLSSARLSHHTGYVYVTTPAGATYPTGIGYSRARGADPIIWVANGKHANYTSQSACDAGTGGGYLVDLVFSFDTCGGNLVYFRATTGANRNIGSAGTPLINQVASSNIFYQTPVRYEYLWRYGVRFYGWQLDKTTSSEGYPTILERAGFGVSNVP